MKPADRYLNELVNYLNKVHTDEAFLQKVEKKAGVREAARDDYRRQVMAYVGSRVWKHERISLPLKLQAALDGMSRPQFQVSIEGDEQWPV